MAKTNRDTNTYEIIERDEFARIVAAFRAAGQLRSYGRLAGFGRSLITAEGATFLYTAWFGNAPSMNINRKVA